MNALNSARTIPILAKHKNTTIGSEDIQKALDEFRRMFPEQERQLRQNEAQIRKAVANFLVDDRIVSLRPEVHQPLVQAPAVRLCSVEGVTSTCPFAIGVVVVDCIFMTLGFVGLHASNTELIARAAAREIGEEVVHDLPKWLKLINAFREAGGIGAQSKAVFDIGSAAYKAGMFKAVLTSIISSMEWWDWVITGVTAVAQIGALFLTDGAAFIAELALNGAAVATVVSDSAKAVDICG